MKLQESLDTADLKMNPLNSGAAALNRDLSNNLDQIANTALSAAGLENARRGNRNLIVNNNERAAREAFGHGRTRGALKAALSASKLANRDRMAA